MVASLLAQDSISRQMASVARQRRASAGPGRSLQTQQLAVARQRVAAARGRPEEPWNVSPSTFGNFGTWNDAFQAPACPSLEWQQARDRFEEEERRDELPSGLLGAVALQESGLYPCAVSGAGATGLMQLMPATAAEFGVGNPLDPWQNLQGGGQFLRQLLGRYNGDLRLALGAYNAGPSRVDYFGGVPPFAETQNYVESIMTRMKRSTVVENPVKP
jgi:soluble lytic murein transglycosylase-like protein